MKHNYLKSMLVMLMMMVGMSAWAEEVQIYLNEGATGTANGITASGNVNTNTKNGNPGNSFANTTSSNTTFTFSGFNVSSYSNLKLVLDANWSQFPSTTNTFPSVTVKAYKNEVEVFSDETTIAVDEKTTGYNEYTVNITADFDKIVLTRNPSEGKTAKGAASTVYSLYMDNIKVYGTREAGAAPVNSLSISPAAGTYETAQNVTLTAGLAGSTIYYTTDGTKPTTSSTVYTAAIPVTTATTIKALAVKDGSDNVDAEAAYVIKPAQPSYLVDGNSVGTSKAFRNSAEVTISAADGCDIYYTTDGSTPTASSTAYTGAFTVTETTTVKAIAVDAYDNVSSYRTLTLTLIEGTLFAFDDADALTAWDITLPNTGAGTDLSNSKEFVADGITVQVNKGGTTNTRIWNASGTYDLRLYGTSSSKGSIVVTAPTGFNVTSVIFEGSTVSMSNLTSKAWTGNAHSITFEASSNQKISNVTVKVESTAPTYTAQSLELKALGNKIDGYNDHYATFSSSKGAFFPNSFFGDAVYFTDVYTLSVDGDKLTMNMLDDNFSYDNDINGESISGYYVPANTGVLVTTFFDVEDVSPITYYDVKNVAIADVKGNMLRPASQAKETDGSYKFYKLAYSDSSMNPTSLGFYWGADQGGAFTSREGSAYLAVPASAGGSVKGFSFADVETAIKNVVSQRAESNKIFNLQGQRVNAAQKGIYIINGKKVVK